MNSILKLVRQDWTVFLGIMSITGERQSILLMVLFGLWTALPWVSFQAKAYEFLNRFLPENGIGWTMLFIGLIHALTVLHSIDPASKVRQAAMAFRYALLLIETMIWIGFGVTSLVSYPPSLGFIAYTWYGWGSFQAFHNLQPDLHSLVRKGEVT
jgi:hypothetical protein